MRPNTRFKRLRRERPYYLIPIMMGMAGVAFSTQLEDPALRAITVLLCLAIPLMFGGNILGRVYSDGFHRFLLLGGMATLTIGAALTVSGLAESLVSYDFVSKQVGEISRWMGMGSLLLGLLVVLYTIVRSEALFDELEDRFRHVANHIGEGFILLNARGEVVLVNRALVATSGIPESEMVGRKSTDIAAQYGVRVEGSDINRRNGALATTYQATWTRDGDERRLLINESPLFDRRKRRVGTLLALHDITEEHRLKVRLEEYTQGLEHVVEDRTASLRASEARYRGLLLTMNEGFVTADSDLKIRFSNERVHEILCTSSATITGRSLTDIVHPDDRERLVRDVRRAASSRSGPGQEYLLLRDDGGTVPVKASVAVLEAGPEFGQSRFSLVITDVQELKRMQLEIEQRARELELANAELRELDRAKDIFLSNVSHELRTPLGTLDGYIDMLQSEALGNVSGPQRAAFDVMSRNVQRLAAMITEMIESSRIQIRGVVLVRELWSLRRIVEEAEASARPAAVEKHLNLTLSVADSAAYQWGDRDKLTQVLGILLSNAVKFTPEGGRISLDAGVENGDVVLSVKDTGIGIPSEQHERVFRKFYQVDSSMTRHYQGTGIGLSIAKAVVEAHGGRIELDSAPGQGSEFRVVLPGAAFRPSDAPRALAGKRVVVVNEFVESLEALAEALGSAGASVTTLVSGFECVRRAREIHPDAIIVDEAVRDLPVVEIAQRLRQQASAGDVPIVTLWDRRGNQPGGEELAAADLTQALLKPFSPVELVQCVVGAIARSTPGAESSPLARNMG